MSLGGLWIIGQISGGTKFDLRSLQWASPFFYSTIHERKGTLKCLRTYSQCTQQKGGANPQGWKDNYLLEKLRHFSLMTRPLSCIHIQLYGNTVIYFSIRCESVKSEAIMSGKSSTRGLSKQAQTLPQSFPTPDIFMLNVGIRKQPGLFSVLPGKFIQLMSLKEELGVSGSVPCF